MKKKKNVLDLRSSTILRLLLKLDNCAQKINGQINALTRNTKVITIRLLYECYAYMFLNSIAQLNMTDVFGV